MSYLVIIYERGKDDIWLRQYEHIRGHLWHKYPCNGEPSHEQKIKSEAKAT
jgi:hypothetical protein